MSEPLPDMNSDDIELPPDAELVRATGRCSLCDSRFREKLVWAFAAPDQRSGVAFVEARHLGPRRHDAT